MPTTNTPVYVTTNRRAGPYWRISLAKINGMGARVVRWAGSQNESEACTFATKMAAHAFGVSVSAALAGQVYVEFVQRVVVLRRVEASSDPYREDVTRELSQDEMTAEELAIVAEDERQADPVMCNLPYDRDFEFVDEEFRCYLVKTDGEVKILVNGGRSWRKIAWQSKRWYDVHEERRARIAQGETSWVEQQLPVAERPSMAMDMTDADLPAEVTSDDPSTVYPVTGEVWHTHYPHGLMYGLENNGEFAIMGLAFSSKALRAAWGGLLYQPDMMDYLYEQWGDEGLTRNPNFASLIHWELKERADRSLRTFQDHPCFETAHALRHFAVECFAVGLIDRYIRDAAILLASPFTFPRIEGDTFISDRGHLPAPEFDRMGWYTPWIICGSVLQARVWSWGAGWMSGSRIMGKPFSAGLNLSSR